MSAPRCTPKKPKVPKAFLSAAHPPMRSAAGGTSSGYSTATGDATSYSGFTMDEVERESQ